MATRDSTNDALAEQRAIISRLFDDIKRRDEQAYAMVSAIKSWLPNDLQPDDSGQKYTTQHLLDLLEDLPAQRVDQGLLPRQGRRVAVEHRRQADRRRA